ncbi:MAG: 16S rRNA (guanine(966)-N(2))-methyltransferase RsmD [Planctomycetes bacterium]|nr:16S rRNA (guanine(966)-N(2))-methyltransferase RsmD [Planctomycetota bacterium]
MRIIAGIHRGRKILAPAGLTTRPMTDRVRENLFNLLGDTVAGAAVLDLFCGSGALGLEALSRGAAWCTFVDLDRAAAGAVETNCRRLGLQGRARILRRDALRPGPWLRPGVPGHRPPARQACCGPTAGDPAGPGAASPWQAGTDAYTLIFVDPPYRMTADLHGQERLAALAADLARLGLLAAGATAMLRAERGVRAALPWPGFEPADERSYGTTTLYLMTYRGSKSAERRT